MIPGELVLLPFAPGLVIHSFLPANSGARVALSAAAQIRSAVSDKRLSLLYAAIAVIVALWPAFHAHAARRRVLAVAVMVLVVCGMNCSAAGVGGMVWATPRAFAVWLVGGSSLPYLVFVL